MTKPRSAEVTKQVADDLERAIQCARTTGLAAGQERCIDDADRALVAALTRSSCLEAAIERAVSMLRATILGACMLMLACGGVETDGWVGIDAEEGTPVAEEQPEAQPEPLNPLRLCQPERGDFAIATSACGFAWSGYGGAVCYVDGDGETGAALDEACIAYAVRIGEAGIWLERMWTVDSAAGHVVPSWPVPSCVSCIDWDTARAQKGGH